MWSLSCVHAWLDTYTHGTAPYTTACYSKKTNSTKNVKFIWKIWKWDFQFSTRFIKFPALFIFGVTLTSLVTLTFDLGIRNFHTIFLVMLAICVHEFNRIQVFFLDKNHLKTPKVMTLTFYLENEKQYHFIELWCILYLNI